MERYKHPQLDIHLDLSQSFGGICVAHLAGFIPVFWWDLCCSACWIYPNLLMGSVLLIFLVFCVVFFFFLLCLSSSCALYAQCYQCFWFAHSWLLLRFTLTMEMPVPSQGHYGFPSFPVVDWFCLFIYLWVLTFHLEDCSEFGNFVITLIYPSNWKGRFSYA